jgi:hypothetical protein
MNLRHTILSELHILAVQIGHIMLIALVIWIASKITPYEQSYRTCVAFVGSLRLLRNYLLWEHHPKYTKQDT